jgi:alkanesulfonate monooxygenase SsuD/methylene tetrahydromethanopterin reductase-like flavin-dependent oxidoreductase (luciferase family)
MLDLAKRGRPFMMNVQSDTVIAERFDLYRNALRKAGHTDAQIKALVDASWIWRNVFVADTDAEAERIAVPAFTAMNELRAAMRNKITAEQGVSLAPPDVVANPARTSIERGLVFGSPATVAQKLTPILKSGVGGMIIQFRLGPMSFEQTEASLRLFQAHVVPKLNALQQN